jgi:creatinine amidohydrolase/Fe(II)-dependent formamide hydrolase-like protein
VGGCARWGAGCCSARRQELPRSATLLASNRGPGAPADRLPAAVPARAAGRTLDYSSEHSRARRPGLLGTPPALAGRVRSSRRQPNYGIKLTRLGRRFAWGTGHPPSLRSLVRTRLGLQLMPTVRRRYSLLPFPPDFGVVPMRHSLPAYLGLMLLGVTPLAGQVLAVADLNTRQIAALDRAKTVVLLQGGMLEEHGPYLPAFTDGILSARLTDALAEGISHQLPEWTVLRFPVISVGASGSNEIGGQFVFPGTYTVRPSILRAMLMDLATELGEQGFRWIMVVHVHGSPLHIEAIDDAGDYFHDAYGGTMVNLWGLPPVLAGWGSVLGTLPDSIKREDGVSLHAGLDEHSMMLYLDSTLVAPDYRSAPTVAGPTYDSSFAVARRPGWPGYLGAPRLATATLGKAIWDGFSAATIRTAVEVLKGTDPSTYQRYMTFLRKSPLYQQWIAAAEHRDAARSAKQRTWYDRRSAQRAPQR